MKGIFLVGGAVRDKLLNKPINDKDYVAVGYKQEDFSHWKLVGKDFPVFLNDNDEEVALARIERKISDGYNGFIVETENVSLEDDLKRRDLTINSMAELDNKIFDPFNGQKDLENKILRHTSEAFSEDPLRVLRLARFSARFPDFTIANETMKLAYSLRDELKSLTAERVWIEVEKTLKTEKPSKFFRTLDEIGVLDEVFPELFQMKTIPQKPNYHAEGDLFTHTMMVLDEVCKLSNDPVVRFSVLYHDIGKIDTFLTNGNLHGHEDINIVKPRLDDMKKKYKIPNEFYKQALSVAILHGKIHSFPEMRAKTKVKLFNHKYFPRDIDGLLDAVSADSTGRIQGEFTLNPEDIQDKDEFFVNGSLFRKGRSGKFDRELFKKQFLACKKVSPVSYMEEFEKTKNCKPSVEQIKAFINRTQVEEVKNV
jgi:tRNA nucleotidyltransferase (CCA-adding enzyme)